MGVRVLAAGLGAGAAPAALEVPGTPTVREVKERLQAKTGLAVGRQTLEHGGVPLADGARLGGEAGPAEVTLRAAGGLPGGTMIKVRTLTGKEIEIDIELTDNVERIKERVEEKEGIPPVQQRLIFSGKQMNDDKTAKDYNIEGGSVLHLVLALRGGVGLSA